MLAWSCRASSRRWRRRARKLNLPVEIVSSARAADIDPGITMDITGAVFHPLDAHLDPRLLLRKLTELVVAAVTIHWSTRLDAWPDGVCRSRPLGQRAPDADDCRGSGAVLSRAACPGHRAGAALGRSAPVLPDGLPYIGRFAPYSNLCMAAGHAMLGISLAPITGQLVSQVLTGDQPRVALELLSPQRHS